MANGNTSVSRLGQINLSGGSYANDTALFLKKFAGEVLTSFTTNNVMKDLHTVRTISNGKSAQFPVAGIASAKYHTPGDRITDAGNSYQSQIKHSEVVVNIDGLLLSTTFISNIEEAMNHYDVRSIYTTELGRALAQRFDRQVMQAGILGAQGAANITAINGTILGGSSVGSNYDGTTLTATSTSSATVTLTVSGGTNNYINLNVGEKITITGATAAGLNGTWVVATKPGNTSVTIVVKNSASYNEAITAKAYKAYGSGTVLKDTVSNLNTASNLISAIFNTAQAFDENNVPSEDRVCIVRPSDYYAIVQELSAPAKPSPVGSYVTGDVAQIAGIQIVKSNNLPNTNISSESGQNNTYSGDFTGTRAFVFQKGGLGTVKLMDLAVESEYEIELQGTIMVAKYAMGHKALRPESLAAIVAV